MGGLGVGIIIAIGAVGVVLLLLFADNSFEDKTEKKAFKIWGITSIISSLRSILLI